MGKLAKIFGYGVHDPRLDSQPNGFQSRKNSVVETTPVPAPVAAAVKLPTAAPSTAPASRTNSNAELPPIKGISSDSRGSTPPISPQASRGSERTPPVKLPRFEVFPVVEGQQPPFFPHAHHFKTARRQEKLGRMLRDIVSIRRDELEDDGAELDREAAEAVAQANSGNKPPTLLQGLVQELNQDPRDPGVVLEELLVHHKPSSSLTEKYGRCSGVVGKGSFGVVRLAHKIDPSDKRKKLLYAVKEYKQNVDETSKEYNKRLAAEFCLSSSLHHRNIIETLDLLKDDKGRYCGVMEYCAGGDLYSLIVVAGKLERLEADCIFKQIVRAVAYMHEMGVSHRDLKPENILLTSSGCVKITDFGNAECFRMAWEKEVHLSSHLCGSGPYIAPEEFLDKDFDPRAVDVWSVGVIYLAMRTGRHLWHEAKSSDTFYAKYLEGRKNADGYEPIEKLESSKCRNVIYSILDPRASRRLTPRQVLNSEWGREIKLCEAAAATLAKPDELKEQQRGLLGARP